MSDMTQDASYKAGQLKGQAQVKTNNMVDKASDAAQSAVQSCQQPGQHVKESAQGAVETVKDAAGIKK